jgi:hypothetical protein
MDLAKTIKEGDGRTPRSDSERDQFNEDFGTDGRRSNMHGAPVKTNTLRKSYTVASNAAAEKKRKKLLISKIRVPVKPLQNVKDRVSG